MNQNSKYLLLIDPTLEDLGLQETAIRCFYGGEVLSMNNSSGVADLLIQKGSPELIIADASFYSQVAHQDSSVPFIATIANPDFTKKFSEAYPSVTAVIEKPLSVTSFTYLVKSITTNSIVNPSHVPVRTSLLVKQGNSLCDLYVKLAENNFVKLLHKGEKFSESDKEKLSDKKVDELYIKVEDSKDYLTFLERELSGTTSVSIEDLTLTVENLESFERIAKCMNWSPAVLVSAQKSVSHAVKILSKNQNVIAVLKKRLSEPSSEYSRHVGLLTFLVCAFGSSIASVGESGQIKLALAALIHDVGVDDEFYKNIHEWNKRASDLNDKSPETVRYRMHPFEGSKIVRSFDSHSPDVDQIILQHHEAKNGTGYPRGLDSLRIGHLPALFIMVEDLVEFIGDGENIETSIVDYMMWGSAYYDSGHFKKIFQSIQEKLKQL